MRTGPERRRALAAASSLRQDLRAVLAERDFRRLFATRLISQASDGVFNAGLAAYVFFSAQIFPDPASAAVAFAVLYLPYSLIGPFAGVFIDRWSRRQILVWSALVRAGFVVLTAVLVASGRLGPPLYISALAVLGVNRFFLSALSAALPHVVAGDKLVMANAVGPTSGTIVSFAGGLAGLGLHLATGAGRGGSAVIMLVAGGGYLASGLTATLMPAGLLGPSGEEAAARRAGVGPELRAVAAGLAAGARHIARRRLAAAALGATASHRFLYGIMLLMSVLLYRNYFYAGHPNRALSQFTLVVAASAAGYGLAAVITPVVTRRLSKPAWITVVLAASGLLTGTGGATFSQLAFALIGFALGVAAQGIAICTTTILQEQIADDFRGRVFAVNDMLYNGVFVLGAAVSAVFMPVDGRSYPMLIVVAAGYLTAAAGYRTASRQPSGAGRAGPTPDSTAQRSNSSVARSAPSGPCSSRRSSRNS